MNKDNETKNIGYKKGTEFIKYDGTFVKIEDIKKSDKLMGADFLPKEVTNVSNKSMELYKITPVNGLEYYVGGDQTICLKYSNVETVTFSKDKYRFRVALRYAKLENNIPKIKYKSYKLKSDDKELIEKMKKEGLKELSNMKNEKLNHGDTIEMTISDYLKLNNEMKTAFKWYRTGIEFKHQDVPIDPYLLGVWLGDGHSDGVNITNEDQEIIDKITEIVPQYGLICKKVKAKLRYSITKEGHTKKGENKFRNFLNEYKLIKNKHIPDIYKYNSRDIRLKVLAGLIDSDGWYNEDGNTFCFTMSNNYELLIDDMIYLIRSLGFSTYKYYKRAKCTNGKNGPVYTDCSRFEFSGIGQETIPCAFSKKLARNRITKKSNMVTGIKIESVGKDSCYKMDIKGSGKVMLADFSVGYI